MCGLQYSETDSVSSCAARWRDRTGAVKEETGEGASGRRVVLRSNACEVEEAR